MSIINQPVMVNDMKEIILENIGKKICVIEVNKAGRTIYEYCGEIVGGYSNFFTVKIKIGNSYLNKSFSYIDFFLNTLKYKIT